MIKLPTRWLGTDESYANLQQRLSGPLPPDQWYEGIQQAYERSYSGKLARLAKLRSLNDWDDDDEDDPEVELDEMEYLASKLIEVYGSVAVVSIEGGLVPEESWINSWFGVVGYPTIVRAINQCLEDPEISDIVMAISSHGGAADGIGEASDAIMEAGRGKPIYSWTGSSMLSAGYWLGATGRKIYGTKMADIGSVGAISTFVSRYKMMQEAGLDAYIARSTPLKGVPHPMEPISKEGKQVLNEDVTDLHNFFIDHVVSNRPNLQSSNAKETWATGGSFFGAEALQLGLIDGVRPLADLIQSLNASEEARQNSGGGEMPKRVVLMNEEARARVALGTPLEQVSLSEEMPEVPGKEAPMKHGADLQAQQPEPETPSEPPTEPELPEAPAAVLEAAASGLETYVLDELKELRKANKELQATLSDSEQKLKALQAEHAAYDGLRAIAEASVSRLMVGLGHRPMKLAEMPDNFLISTHEELTTELQQLPVGRKSVPPDEEDRGLATPQSVVEQRLHIVPQAQGRR